LIGNEKWIKKLAHKIEGVLKSGTVTGLRLVQDVDTTTITILKKRMAGMLELRQIILAGICPALNGASVQCIANKLDRA